MADETKDSKSGSPSGRAAGYGDMLKTYADATNAYLTFYSLIQVDESEENLHKAQFLAFISAFDEKFEGAWESQQFFGKTDPIVGFKGTRRTITFSWNLPSATLEEAIENMKNINNLAMMLYPAYMAMPTQGHGLDQTAAAWYPYSAHCAPLSKPPYVRVEWANLVNARGSALVGVDNPSRSLVGWLDGLRVDAKLDEGFFGCGDKLYPKVWSLGCTFTPLHQHALGRGEPLW